MIANHVCAGLSQLDLRIAHCVPPGGNWRDIPEDVPSERLAQIRVSAAAGEGSRSTYYGRLHPEKPSYTVNTYYNRPGNGCFLHYDDHQDRTLSHREAARLQSFPDDFAFVGPQRAVCQQIGNAVPPLLAFQIARALGDSGVMVDVFAGAGGLSLGFKWGGWTSLAAVDIDRHAVATFNANVEPVAFVGDMEDGTTHDRLSTAKGHLAGRRLALVGGPPCQGFSTGGKRRSPDDARNNLHKSYTALLSRLRPDVFVFENVLGLLSMEAGSFLKRILQGFASVGYDVAVWRVNAARFGIPQRRDRVIIVGLPNGVGLPSTPKPWTNFGSSDLFPMLPICGVSGALGDLPGLSAGQDGSQLPYRSPPQSYFQRFARGELSPTEYVDGGGRQRNDSDHRPGSVSGFACHPQAVYSG